MTTQQIQVDALAIARGDTMSPEILSGDLVFIQYGTPSDRQIALVEFEGEATLAWVQRIADGIMLYTNGPVYTPMLFTGAEAVNVRIIGMVVGSVRLIDEIKPDDLTHHITKEVSV